MLLLHRMMIGLKHIKYGCEEMVSIVWKIKIVMKIVIVRKILMHALSLWYIGRKLD